MPRQTLGFRLLGLVLGAAVFLLSGTASADPPSRVARLGYTAGAVSFSASGEDEWVRASVNRPLANGDRLWVDANARAEIQDGGAMIRLSANTSVSVLNLDERITQLQLTQGTLNVRVRRLAPSQVIEVDTPHLALTLRQAGDYRIAVDADGNATDVIVRQGQGEVLGEGAGYLINAQQSYRFRGNDLRDYELLDAPRPDELDRWAGERDRLFDRAISARYVSRDVVGYQDLDANGTWRVDATYGNVWLPNRVASDWAPYRDGHWAWIDPWGWTWIDDAPWGFAVSHYGRWANLGNRWAWVPGPARLSAYYAPALVVFVGGDNFHLAISSGNVGGVAWFPLAPREVYRPAYAASRSYFENVNRSNTVVNNTVINNFYNTTNVTQVVYANRHVTGAVIAVPTTTFVQSQPVARAVVRVDRDVLANASLGVATHVAPTVQSVRGPAVSGVKPPSRFFDQRVVARTAPPAAHVGFVAQPLAGQVNPPLATASGQGLRREAALPRPTVKVLSPAALAPPKTLPAAPPASRAVAAQPPVVQQPIRSGELPTPPQRIKQPTPVAMPPVAPSASRPAAVQPPVLQQPIRSGATPPTPPQPIKQPTPVAVPPVAASASRPAAVQPQVVQQPIRSGATPTLPQRIKQPTPVAVPPVAASLPAPAAKQPEPRSPVAVPKPPLRPLPIQPEPRVDPSGQALQRGNGQQRAHQIDPATPVPVQRAPEPRPVSAPVVPAATATQAPPQRPTPPKLAPPQPVAVPTPAAIQQPVKVAPAARPVEQSPPVAAPRPAPAQNQSVPQADKRGQRTMPAASKPGEGESGRDAGKHEQESDKQKK